MRFRNKQDPNLEDVTFNKSSRLRDGGAVNIVGVGFITVRGFTIQGAASGVHIRSGAHDNIVEKNSIFHGNHSVFIYGDKPRAPCHRNIVRNNKMTLNYIHDLSALHPLHAHIWDQFKLFSDTDRHGVYLLYAGDDNEVYDNEIYQHWDGVQDSAGGETREEYATYCRRLKVYGNSILEMGDDALEPTGGEIDAEWHDNVCQNALINIRIKDIKTGPCYVYGNRFCTGPGEGGHGGGRDIYFFAGSDATVYLYHNSFASNSGLVMGSTTPERGAPNTWFINNIFSNATFWKTTPKWNFNAHAHANWCGGDATLGGWLTGNNFVAPGVRLWDAKNPSFLLTAESPVLGKGIDLSKPTTLDGKTIGPMPGMKPGCFRGAKPDLGAIQFKQ